MKIEFELPDAALEKWAPKLTQEEACEFARNVTTTAMMAGIIEDTKNDMAKDFHGVKIVKAKDERVSAGQER